MILNMRKFLLFIAISWPLLVLVNHFNPTSKFSLYRIDLNRYLRDYAALAESATQAKHQLERELYGQERLLFDLNTTNYICVGVISKRRMGTNQDYVKQALMSILARVSFQREDKIRLVAFNLEPEPSQNVHLLKFKRFIRIVNASSGLKGHAAKIVETLDYTRCMKYFISLKCKYSLLVEDDALIAQNWFEILDQEMKKIQNTQHNNWLMIKLFTGIIFLNNDWMQSKYPWVIFKVTINAFFLLLIQLFIFKLIFKHILKIYVPILLINCSMQACYFNSSSTIPFGQGLRVQRTGFGSVAVLFPIKHLVPLADYLEKIVLNYVHQRSSLVAPKDILIEKYRMEHNLDELIMEPSLVQHTGLHSSLENRSSGYLNFHKMFKSFTFPDDFRKIELKLKTN